MRMARRSRPTRSPLPPEVGPPRFGFKSWPRKGSQAQTGRRHRRTSLATTSSGPCSRPCPTTCAISSSGRPPALGLMADSRMHLPRAITVHGCSRSARCRVCSSIVLSMPPVTSCIAGTRSSPRNAGQCSCATTPCERAGSTASRQSAFAAVSHRSRSSTHSRPMPRSSHVRFSERRGCACSSNLRSSHSNGSVWRCPAASPRSATSFSSGRVAAVSSTIPLAPGCCIDAQRQSRYFWMPRSSRALRSSCLPPRPRRRHWRPTVRRRCSGKAARTMTTRTACSSSAGQSSRFAAMARLRYACCGRPSPKPRHADSPTSSGSRRWMPPSPSHLPESLRTPTQPSRR